MNLLRSRFVQAVLILVVAFCLLRFGIRPPAPWSVIKFYLLVVCLAVLIYVSSDVDSWRSFVRPIRSTLVDPNRRLLRLALAVILPILLGYYAYSQAAGAARAARGASGAAGVDPVPGQGDQHLRRGESAAQGSGEVQGARGRGRRDVHPQLHLLPRRQPRRPGPLRQGIQPAAGQLPGPWDDRDAPGGVSVLARRQGRAGASQGIDAVELRHAGVGRPPDRRADLAGHHVSLRRDGPA